MKEAGYQVSKEEQNRMVAESRQLLGKVVGKTLLSCDSAWSTEQWMWFGVEEFPDIEAVQEHTKLLLERDWFRYLESFSILGTETAPS